MLWNNDLIGYNLAQSQPSKQAVQDLKLPGNGPLQVAAGRCLAILDPVRHAYGEAIVKNELINV